MAQLRAVQELFKLMLDKGYYTPENPRISTLHSEFMCNALDLAAANGSISYYERDVAKKAIQCYMYTLGSGRRGTLAATLNVVHPAHLPPIFTENGFGATSEFYHKPARKIFGDWRARPKSPEAYVTFATNLFNKEA